MKTAKGFLLSSLAAVIAPAAADAADFPVQGTPVEYVQVCPQYGDAIRHVPGACGFSLGLYSGPADLVARTFDNAVSPVVADLRVDQSWGAARLKAMLRQSEGWATGAGVAFDIPGTAGDSISFETNYAQGTPGYASRANRSWQMWGDGRAIGPGWTSESLFRDGTDLALTRSWSFVAAGEHRWNTQWRTAVYGGYERIDHSARSQDMICRGGFAGSASALVGLSASNCNPDLSWWSFGTRTQWNPHPLLDIGLDVVYRRPNTAQRGTSATTTVDDPDHLSAMFRIQYNLRP
jgi:hypothetical protein